MPRKPRRPPVSRDKRFKRQQLLPDSGPPERWQHSARSMEFTDAAGIFAARAEHEHVLDRLFMHKLITGAEREAGLKLAESYNIARIEEKISASLTPLRGQQSIDPQRRLERSEKQERAYKSWRNGLAACSPFLRDTLIHVTCVGCWPSLEQLSKLKAGLGQLAKHYGMRD